MTVAAPVTMSPPAKTLPALVDAQHDELAGQPLSGDAGGLDPEQLDVGGEEACFEQQVHESG
jgi:hypothetical protein